MADTGCEAGPGDDVQRLIAQADGAARTIAALAELVRLGTERCERCPIAGHPHCDACTAALAFLESLGVGDRAVARLWGAVDV